MRVVGIILSALMTMGAAASAHAQGSEMLQAPSAEEGRGEDVREPAAPTPQPRATPVTAPAPAAPTQDANLGGAGESCRARSDCASGLRCFANVCRDPLEGTACGASSECGPNLRCYEQTCQSPVTVFTRAEPEPEPAAPSGVEEEALTLRGARGFIGASLMLGPTYHEWSNSLNATLLVGLRGGLIVSGNELALEITPFSSFYGFEVPMFQLNASYGYLIPMTRSPDIAVYWPLRAGVGFLVGDPGEYVEARADVVGVAIQVGQMMLDLHFPSFRFAWHPGWPSHFIMHWYGGVSISYLF